MRRLHLDEINGLNGSQYTAFVQDQVAESGALGNEFAHRRFFCSIVIEEDSDQLSGGVLTQPLGRLLLAKSNRNPRAQKQEAKA